MPSLGFSREVIEWYKSYLSIRKFRVNVHGKFSTSADLRWGVPQESILGPLLFLLYIKDMIQAADCDPFIFVGDTCLLFQDKDLEQIKEELTKDLSNICGWFVGKKLNIHFGGDKTKSIFFCSKNRKNKIGTLDFNVKINQYSKVTYLGCELNKSLSWEAMALKVVNKINGSHITPYLKRLLYNALIQPHFNYACSAWNPNLNKKFKRKLQTKANVLDPVSS